MWTQTATLLFGDIDCNGKISNTDVALLYNKLHGNVKFGKTSTLFKADVDGNGIVNDNDSNTLHQVDLGKLAYNNLPVHSNCLGISVNSISKTNYEYGEEFDYAGIVLSLIHI